MLLEMDDLTTSVFEEAHEMVRVEKEARFLADKRYTETKQQNDVQLQFVTACVVLPYTSISMS